MTTPTQTTIAPPKPITHWTPDRLPSLKGKTYLITGGNSGIGIEAAKMLGTAGADVIIACRNPEKGNLAVNEIAQVSHGKVDLVQLDLSDLASVKKAAEEVRQRFAKLDGLINNAGIMQTPELKTADGFELQLGTNHLGHFLFAGLLLDLVEKASGRIVVVSSIAHKFGKIHFDDLMFSQNYDSSKAYFQSKLANLMFAFELDRRLKASDSKATCYACHPGYSATKLQSTGPQGTLNLLYKILNPLLAQSSYKGAIPTVLAAAGTEAVPGHYYGPRGIGDARGPVGDANIALHALDKEVARRLWDESEQLVQLQWPQS